MATEKNRYAWYLFEADRWYIQDDHGFITVIVPPPGITGVGSVSGVKGIMTTYSGSVEVWTPEHISLSHTITKHRTCDGEFGHPFKKGDPYSYNKYGWLPDPRPIEYDKIAAFWGRVMQALCDDGILKNWRKE